MPALTAYLDRLRELPFVRDVAVTASPPQKTVRPDAVVKVRTPRRTFGFALEIKRTFLDRALTNAIIAEHGALLRKLGLPLLLMARYIPRPTGERLAEAGVNFVDVPGNIHLRLGQDHHVLVLGRREVAAETTARRPAPALIQLFFLLLAEPSAAGWPVRRLADEAGIGKTAAATGVQRLAHAGVLAPGREGTYRIADPRRLTDDFLRGYADVLRPHLEVGRYRGPEREPEKFLEQLADTANNMQVKWALTGTPAAYALDRFYRGDDVPVFIEGFTPRLQRVLRLVADRAGRITVLRPFGRRWAWEAATDVPVVHPWLVYAELLHLGEPRALEAAEHIRERFLAT